MGEMGVNKLNSFGKKGFFKPAAKGDMEAPASG